MAEIREVVSESLQATIRRLLPSQKGFSEDLQATNVITPVIDLTPTAEGSALPYQLSTAHALGSNTSFEVNATAATIINTTGFYRVFGTAQLGVSSTAARVGRFDISDGTTTKIIYLFKSNTGINGEVIMESFDFVVYLRAGETFNANNGANVLFTGSYRQIADVYGNIVNPGGFTFE